MKLLDLYNRILNNSQFIIDEMIHTDRLKNCRYKSHLLWQESIRMDTQRSDFECVRVGMRSRAL